MNAKRLMVNTVAKTALRLLPTLPTLPALRLQPTLPTLPTRPALRLLPMLLALLALCLFAPPAASAQEAPEDARSVYIGDIITLEVTARGYSAEDMPGIFHGFEIVEIEEDAGVFKLSLRTFDPGEQRMLLGDMEIVIDVRSTLDEIDREGVFEGDGRVAPPGPLVNWRVLLYAAAGALALSGGFALWRVLRNKNGKKISSIQLFLRRSDKLSVDDDNYFVDLTFYFKEYLEALYECRIIGKTSDEIMGKLEGFQPLGDMLPDMRAWLAECDRLKFTGVMVSAEEKKEHCGKLVDLALRIDASKGEAA